MTSVYNLALFYFEYENNDENTVNCVQESILLWFLIMKDGNVLYKKRLHEYEIYLPLNTE